MSFILDALRRAQNAHDHSSVDSTPIFADRVPDAPTNYRQRGLWLLGALLTLGVVAILAWWFGRVSVSAPAQAPVAQATPPESRPRAATTTPDGAVRPPVRALDQEVARPRPAPASTPRAASAPAAVRPGRVTVMPDPSASSVSSSSTATTPEFDDPSIAALPQYENLLVEGAINLPNLKMDMHVYNRTPSKRFVFINFKKYRQGDTVDRHTAIEEITKTGAVMNHDGQRFLLRPN